MTIPRKTHKNYRPSSDESVLVRFARQFSEKKRPTYEEANIFKELFYSLVPKISLEDLQSLSSILASASSIPRPIIVYLAMEQINVASSILLASPVLNETDLMAIAAKKAGAHADVIARRDKISNSLKIHLEKLKLQEKNKPQNLLNEHIEKAPEEHINTSTKPTNTPLTTTEPFVDRSSELIKLASKVTGSSRKTQANNIPLKKADFENQLLSQMRYGDHDAFVQSLAFRSGLKYNYITKLFQNEDVGNLASLFRALDIQPSISSRLLLLASRKLGQNSAIFSQVLSMYSRLSAEKCRDQFAQKGANFVHYEKPEHVDTPHFAKLLEERRHSLSVNKISNNRIDTSISKKKNLSTL